MNNTDSFFEHCPQPELGFTPPDDHPLGEERGPAAFASLLASIALVVATLLVMSAAFGVSHTSRAGEPLQQSTQNGPSFGIRS